MGVYQVTHSTITRCMPNEYLGAYYRVNAAERIPFGAGQEE